MIYHIRHRNKYKAKNQFYLIPRASLGSGGISSNRFLKEKKYVLSPWSHIEKLTLTISLIDSVCLSTLEDYCYRYMIYALLIPSRSNNQFDQVTRGGIRGQL
jgi:hypothetical protein